MALTTFTATELSRLGGFSYSNVASKAVADKLNLVTAEVPSATPLAPTADTVSSAVGAVNAPFASKVTIPAGSLAAGSRLSIRAAGVCTASVGAVNLTITLKLGATTVCTVAAFDPGAGTGFSIDSMVVVQSAGATGKFNSGSVCISKAGAGTVVVEPSSFYQSSVDTTAANDVTVNVSWAAGAGETVRLNVLSVDLTY